MKVLFATNLSIAGCQSNEARVNGKNITIVAMGDPFGAMFTGNSRESELAEIIFCRELVDVQMPDIDGLVVATEGDECLFKASVVLAHARKAKEEWQLGLHLVSTSRPGWAENHDVVFHSSHEPGTGGVNGAGMMRYILERFLATGKLTGRF